MKNSIKISLVVLTLFVLLNSGQSGSHNQQIVFSDGPLIIKEGFKRFFPDTEAEI